MFPSNPDGAGGSPTLVHERERERVTGWPGREPFPAEEGSFGPSRRVHWVGTPRRTSQVGIGTPRGGASRALLAPGAECFSPSWLSMPCLPADPSMISPRLGAWSHLHLERTLYLLWLGVPPPPQRARSLSPTFRMIANEITSASREGAIILLHRVISFTSGARPARLFACPRPHTPGWGQGSG